MKKLMSNKEYHEYPAISSGRLKDIHGSSIAHALAKTFEQTENMILGSYVHALLLEPESKGNYIVMPKIDRRTSAGKAAFEEFTLKSEGRTILTQEISDIAHQVAESVMSHPVAKHMLVGGESEYSYFALDEVTGLSMKCRPDYKKSGALIDLKTTLSASFEGFSREIGKWHYYLQAAYYLDVHNLATGENVKDFFFIAVEKKEPFAVAVYQLSEADIIAGRQAYRAAFNQYADYLKRKKEGADLSKYKHGYPPVISVITAPFWVHNQIKVGDDE